MASSSQRRKSHTDLSVVSRSLADAYSGPVSCLDAWYPCLEMPLDWHRSSIPQSELNHHLRTSNTRYVVTLPKQLRVVEGAVQTLGSKAEVILFTELLMDMPEVDTSHLRLPSARSYRCNSVPTNEDDLKTYRNLHHPMGGASEHNLQSQLSEVSANEIAALMSTSGTTGLPKTAARTHLAMILESKAIEDDKTAKPYEVRRLFCTPIFHAFSAPEMLINPLRLGYATYFTRLFDDTFAQKVHDFGITEIAAPPPLLMSLLQQADAHRLLQNLRLIFSGEAPLVADLRSKVLEIFERTPRIVHIWGMTEGGWFSTFKYPEDDAGGSVGRAVPGCEVKMNLADLIEIADRHAAGEILLKGPKMMTGYLGNAQATEEAFTEDGWLKTGDVG